MCIYTLSYPSYYPEALRARFISGRWIQSVSNVRARGLVNLRSNDSFSSRVMIARVPTTVYIYISIHGRARFFSTVCSSKFLRSRAFFSRWIGPRHLLLSLCHAELMNFRVEEGLSVCEIIELDENSGCRSIRCMLGEICWLSRLVLRYSFVYVVCRERERESIKWATVILELSVKCSLHCNSWINVFNALKIIFAYLEWTNFL